MYAVSQQMRDLICDGALAATIDLTHEGEQIATTTDGTLELVDGSMTWDATRPVRHTIDATFIADGVPLPVDLHSPVSPFSDTVLDVRWVWGDETIPAGRYQIAEPTLLDDVDGVRLQISGADHAQTLADVRWPDPFVPTSTVSIVAAAVDVIRRAHPAATIIANDPGDLVGADLYDRGVTWLETVTALVARISHTVHVDRAGDWVIAQIVLADEQGDPVAVWARGDGLVMPGSSRPLSRDGAVNGVIVRGESIADDVAVDGRAWISDPASALYYSPTATELSASGPMPMIVDESTITTQGDADELAASLLDRHAGISEALVVEVVCDPAVDLGDVVDVSIPTIGVSGLWTVERMTVPLRPGPMSVVMQDRRLL